MKPSIFHGSHGEKLPSPGAEEQAALWAARLGALEPCASHRYAQLFGLQGGGRNIRNRWGRWEKDDTGHIHPYSVPYSSINHGTFFFGEYGNKCDFHVGEKDDTGIPGLVFTFTENELERSTIFGG